MTQKDIDFIIDTLETAIEWAEYADDYFKKKHGLEKDKENVSKSIELLKELKANTKKEVQTVKKELTMGQMQDFTHDFIRGMQRCNINFTGKERAKLIDFSNHISTYLEVNPKIWVPKDNG